MRHGDVRQPGQGSPSPRSDGAPSRATQARRSRPSSAPLEHRLDLADEPSHRLLVVRRREAGDQVPVPDLEERRDLLGDVLRRPDRLRGPAAPSMVSVERLLEGSLGLGPAVADEDRSDAGRPLDRRRDRGRRPRNARGGSAPCGGRSRCRRPRCSCRAYLATSRSVTCSPPPPTQIGSCACTGAGRLRTPSGLVVRARSPTALCPRASRA